MADDPDPGARYRLDELAQVLGDAYDAGELADLPAPTHWPAVPAADAAAEWDDLASWVEALCGRFAHLDQHVIPRCWWRHNEHVEALAALRDHERSSFSPTAPVTAPLDWFRALRDVAALLKAWDRRDRVRGFPHRSPGPSATRRAWRLGAPRSRRRGSTPPAGDRLRRRWVTPPPPCFSEAAGCGPRRETTVPVKITWEHACRNARTASRSRADESPY